MTKLLWDEMRLHSPDEDRVWELFHENSKTSPHDSSLSQEEILERMLGFQECLEFDQYPAFDLPPAPVPLAVALDEPSAAGPLAGRWGPPRRSSGWRPCCIMPTE